MPKGTARSRRDAKRFGAKRRAISTAIGVKGEIKCIDNFVTASALAVAATGVNPILTLNAPILGSDFNNRLGRKITMRSVQWRGTLSCDASAGVDVTYRMLVVYDKQTNAAAPTYGTIIRSVNGAGTTQFAIMDMRNLDNRERFVVVHDEMLRSSNLAGNVVDPGSKEWALEGFRPLKGLEAVYNATNGGTQADITSGGLFFYFVASTIGHVPTVTMSFRVRFVDS